MNRQRNHSREVFSADRGFGTDVPGTFPVGNEKHHAIDACRTIFRFRTEKHPYFREKTEAGTGQLVFKRNDERRISENCRPNRTVMLPAIGCFTCMGTGNADKWRI